MNWFKEHWRASDLYGKFVKTETARCTLQGGLGSCSPRIVLNFCISKMFTGYSRVMLLRGIIWKTVSK